MRLARDIDGPVLCPAGSVVAMGAFDGVHLGHQALFAALRARAADAGLLSAVLLFEPLPREFFAREPVLRLMPPAQRLAALRDQKLDVALMLRFNLALSQLSPREFVERALVARLRARHVYVGADFRFGHKRAGDLDTLRELGTELDFTVEALADVRVHGERVSSSAIRQALLESDFAHAERLLGRPYRYAQTVVRGQQLGRTLGYPTANLPWSGAQMYGIYAVRVTGPNLHQHPAVASLGTRPTVHGKQPLLEVHLFDYDGDLYGQRLEIEFVARQRDELKFDSLPALVEQMDRDAATARQLLAAGP